MPGVQESTVFGDLATELRKTRRVDSGKIRSPFHPPAGLPKRRGSRRPSDIDWHGLVVLGIKKLVAGGI